MIVGRRVATTGESANSFRRITAGNFTNGEINTRAMKKAYNASHGTRE
jgi:hypothetical protein